MVPCIEAYAVQDSTQYRGGDFRISADSPPGVGLSIRSPALVQYSALPTQEGSWPSWPNCSEYRYLRNRSCRHFLNGMSSEAVCFQQMTERPRLYGQGIANSAKGHDVLVASVYSVSQLMAVYADLEASCMGVCVDRNCPLTIYWPPAPKTACP
jgi:hypothetical protein